MISFKQTITGQHKKWTLKEKLGEGDAGEVYLVETLLDNQPAILKRPRRSNLPSEVMRQASQIRSEGKILQALSSITYPDLGLCLSTPALLDQSPAEEGLGEGCFIVIQQAAGYDLKSFFRLTRSGLLDEMQPTQGEGYEFFLRTLAGLGRLPEAVLVRSLLCGIELLETIHSSQVLSDGLTQYGVLWNDVKPDHLFWDPASRCLTVIDWGNASFLEADGITRDRQHSTSDDYQQFLLEMGSFLAETNAHLYESLDWPEQITPASAREEMHLLKDKLVPLLMEIDKQSNALRSAEAMLYQTSRPSLEHITQSDDLQREIVWLGEMPDFASAVNFHARLALQMATENDLAGFERLCAKTASLAASSTAKWNLLAVIAAVAMRTQEGEVDVPGKNFAGALAAGVADDWPALLWEIFEFIGTDALPDWWEEVSQGVRQVHLHIGEDLNPPDVAARRLYYTLQTALLQEGDQRQNSLSMQEAEAPSPHLSGEDILKLFDTEVVKKWRQIDPAPPHSGLNYAEVDALLDEIEAILPGSHESFESVLAQPKAHAAIVLDSWERKDFETARQALRRLLLWDPNRRRLLQADRMIQAAPQWLQLVRSGARKDEPFYDYLTSTELAGRKLRNRVGSAVWLDTILEAFKRLRKGRRPADLVMDYPSILEDIPWLNEFRSREVLSLPRSRPLTFEKDQPAAASIRTVSGEIEGKLGEGLDLSLGKPLDIWVPEARGSSARVFEGYLRTRSGSTNPYAIKIMRPERIEYALPLFREETSVLSLLRDAPGVTPLVECGFLRLEDGMQIPGDESHEPVSHLQGMLVRYSVESAQNFLASMDGRLEQGWLPYLALVKRDHRHNLLSYCDAGYTRGWFLPLRESLVLAIQICDILQIAHDRNIAYRDHKILHYYWDPATHGVELIDWNIAKRYAQGLTDAERLFDIVQFGARALHHILTGRPAPGALPLGPNQPEEIERASLSYAVNWTYDDERLPIRIKEVLEQVLNQGYTRVRDLRADLVQIYEQVPGLDQGQEAPPA